MTPPSDIKAIGERLTEADRAIIRRLVQENLALQCLLGGGCDANDDGQHAVVTSPTGEFCSDCGEMTRKGKSTPWLNEDRLNRTIARLAVRDALNGGGE